MQVEAILVLISIVFAYFLSAPVPILSCPGGHEVSESADTHIVIELSVDGLCPDCTAS